MKSLSNYHLSTKETQLPSLASSFPGASVSECGVPLSNTSVLVLEAFSRKLQRQFTYITLKSYRSHAVKDYQQVIQEVVRNSKSRRQHYRVDRYTTRWR
jgi:hypothetical protein